MHISNNITIYSKANLPTEYGNFQVVGFALDGIPLDHIALTRGNIESAANLPTRMHSECLTGDVFHSLRCDCRQQLQTAIHDFASRPAALLLYLRQEGRGIGIANKIAAYHLQEQGMDTVDANTHLGFDDDIRSYDLAADMIKILGVKSIELYTNNPNKINALKSQGIIITNRHPIIIKPNNYNEHYLHTKQDRCGHMLNF